jgi:5-methylcytosine-specific restriction protein A
VSGGCYVVLLVMKTLNTIAVPVLNTQRVGVLDAKAGTTERIRGRAWMRIREEVLLRDNFTCVDCGRVSVENEVDHETPLEQGGTNEKSNLRTRCIPCHQAKTADEASARAGRGLPPRVSPEG